MTASEGSIRFHVKAGSAGSASRLAESATLPRNATFTAIYPAEDSSFSWSGHYCFHYPIKGAAEENHEFSERCKQQLCELCLRHRHEFVLHCVEYLGLLC